MFQNFLLIIDTTNFMNTHTYLMKNLISGNVWNYVKK